MFLMCTRPQTCYKRAGHLDMIGMFLNANACFGIISENECVGTYKKMNNTKKY